jgi:heavy metal response regulator
MRILVVEDQPAVASFIIKGLKEESYAVDHAPNGNDALDLAGLGEYDLIVLDVLLPGKSGIEVTKQLRGRGNSTPILMLTAMDAIADRVRGLDSGADDYLTKPFSFEEFLARVRALLRRGDRQVLSKLQLADLVMDPGRHEVTRAGRRIELTAKEYALLEYLLRNKGRILSRTSIIEHVWDLHFDSDTNVVDVYIRYLRKKVDEEHALKLIHTVRGVGYVLRDTP